mgnify:FL=1
MKKINPELLSVFIAVVSIMLTVLMMSVARSSSETAQTEEKGFTSEEAGIINAPDSLLRVLTILCKADSLTLRQKSAPIAESELNGDTFRTLAAKMIATVTDSTQNGVGIAAPQVGILRRVIAVCRTDKEGEPFEIYANVKIDSLYGEKSHAPEGCLSIPGLKGNVDRYSSVIVSYTDPATLRTVRDTVHGFPAIIFQHECDHLEGILYIDKADSVAAVCKAE